MSAVSLALSGFFATACGGLGAYAAFQGTDNSIYDILSQARWWPSLDELTSPKKLSGLIATLPVLLTSFVCHYNLHPVVSLCRVIASGLEYSITSHEHQRRPVM